jgi:hypothetical protein
MEGRPHHPPIDRTGQIDVRVEAIERIGLSNPSKSSFTRIAGIISPPLPEGMNPRPRRDLLHLPRPEGLAGLPIHTSSRPK